MKILYLGEAYGTSAQRSAALVRLGHEVVALNPLALLPAAGLQLWLLNHLPGDLLDRPLAQALHRRIDRGFDLAWVNQGAFLGPRCLAAIRAKAGIVVNYANDNPFSPAGERRFRAYRKALPLYDHVFLPRQENVEAALGHGASAASLFVFTADELVHRPLPPEDPGLAPWHGHLAFAGSWFPERGPFLSRLLDLGVQLRFAGDRWDKAREWPRLQSHWVGTSLHGADYVRSMQGSLAALCLLNAANHDQHTRRTAEIPAVGGVLIAPRTPAHLRLFADGREALLFDGPEEAAQHVQLLAADPERRIALAAAGRARVLAEKRMNEPELHRLLGLAMADNRT